MIDIIKYSDQIWIIEEGGKNILLQDALKYGLTREERLWLFRQLEIVTEKWNEKALFVKNDFLKRLERKEDVKSHEVWEIRDAARGGRMIFIRLENNSIIVATVNKSKFSQSNAVKRGVKRWEYYLKKQKQSQKKSY